MCNCTDLCVDCYWAAGCETWGYR